MTRKRKKTAGRRPRSSKPKVSTANPDVGQLLQWLDFEELTVTEGGKRKKMPNIEVQYRTLFNKSVKGDLNAAKDIVGLLKHYKASIPRPPQETIFKILPDEQYYRDRREQ